MKKTFLTIIFLLFIPFLLLTAQVYAQEEDVEVIEYTKVEVADHDIPGDCWMSFEGAVYDLSDYLPDHDGYMDIREWCGRDMTADFKDKAGEGRDHKTSSYALLERYKIGELKGDIDLVDAQVIVDDVIQDTEVQEKEDTSGDYNILIPFIITTVLYWGLYFLANKKVFGLNILKFKAFWNTVLILSLLIPATGFGVFMIIRTKKPELWDIDFDFMYWHVELSLVMGFVGIYHFIQRIRQYFLQLKKKKSV